MLEDKVFFGRNSAHQNKSQTIWVYELMQAFLNVLDGVGV